MAGKTGIVHAQAAWPWMLQARGPLTALRTLGSILVPRLRQKEGQEIDRDVAQGILTQVCCFCCMSDYLLGCVCVCIRVCRWHLLLSVDVGVHFG